MSLQYPFATLSGRLSNKNPLLMVHTLIAKSNSNRNTIFVKHTYLFAFCVALEVEGCYRSDKMEDKLHLSLALASFFCNTNQNSKINQSAIQQIPSRVFILFRINRSLPELFQEIAVSSGSLVANFVQKQQTLKVWTESETCSFLLLFF